MPLLSGLLYQLPHQHIEDVKHTKCYDAQHKRPDMRSMFGYTIVKLAEDVTYRVGWRDDSMQEFQAKTGDYLIQCPGQPPSIVKTWAELRSTYHIFRKTQKQD